MSLTYRIITEPALSRYYIETAERIIDINYNFFLQTLKKLSIEDATPYANIIFRFTDGREYDITDSLSISDVGETKDYYIIENEGKIRDISDLYVRAYTTATMLKLLQEDIYDKVKKIINNCYGDFTPSVYFSFLHPKKEHICYDLDSPIEKAHSYLTALLLMQE